MRLRRIVAGGPERGHPTESRTVRGSIPSPPLQHRRRAALSLGPRWVRVATVKHGHRRSPTVAKGSEEPQVVERPAHAAGLMHSAESDSGPEGQGRRRRAAVRQQPVSVTTGEPARKLWRIVTADSPVDGH